MAAWWLSVFKKTAHIQLVGRFLRNLEIGAINVVVLSIK